MEIKEIKNRLSILTVLGHYNLKPDKNHRLCCPFHPDKTPSFQVYPETGTWTCFSSNCSAGSGDQVDFIMRKEGITKHQAILKAQELIGDPGDTGPQKTKPVPEKKPAPELAPLLGRMFTYFKNGVSNSQPAKDYLQSRRLDYNKIEAGYNSGQFHHGRRKDEELIKQCLQAGLLSESGNLSRTGEAAYNVFGKGCIVFALRNKQNQVTGLYFRSILDIKEQRHFYLKDRSGLYPGYPNPATEKLILTEAIIDAATLLQIPEITARYSVLACYGTNGLIEQHKAAIKELNLLKEIILFYDGDQAGREAIKKHAENLHHLKPSVKITYAETPENEDINSLSVSHSLSRDNGKPGIFVHLLETRKEFFFSTEIKTTEDPSFESAYAEASADKKKKEPEPRRGGELHTENPYNISYTGLTAKYFIKGGIRPQMDSMRVSLQILPVETITDNDYRTKLDLYEYKQVSSISTAAAEKLVLRADLVEKDLSRLTTLLEEYRDNQLTTNHGGTDTKRVIKVPEATALKCIEFFKKPGLIKNINALIEKAGVTGEETSRILLFVIASSYKMPDTLHALVQGSSGSGKTHLVLNIAQLMPPEDCITLTRVTDSSFYNYGENDLAHKLLCMEDLDGMKEEAFLAFRELQSRGMLTSSTSVKDENGNIRGMVKLVKGPVATISATTAGEIYEDNMSRCFLIAVDESREQSRRIIKYQNEKAAGLTDVRKEEEIRVFLQNSIRLLKPCQVVNPYAEKIELPQEAQKIRRLNELYQSFVKQVTLLNQYQRRKDEQGRLITEKEDLRVACEILFESIILKVDELDGSMRQFYEQLKAHIQRGGNEYRDYQFTAREIRQALSISRTQMHRYINDLLELEYITQAGGYANRGFKYRISYWDDMQALRGRISSHLQEQIEKL